MTRDLVRRAAPAERTSIVSMPSGDRLAPPGPRLMAAAFARLEASGAAFESHRIHAVGPSAASRDGVTPLPPVETGDRLVVFSWIGAHRDARDPLLRRLWDLEEAARATPARVIALRLAPLVGPDSPLVARLAQRPRLDARLARALVQPIHESDVVEGIASLIGRGLEGNQWYEVCGSVPVTVGELMEQAVAMAFGAPAAPPAWEPSPEVLRAQGLAECGPWLDATGLTPRPVLASAPGARA